MKALFLTASHLAAATAGFALGIYTLPVLLEPEGPSQQVLLESQADAQYRTSFRRDLPGSDFLHWGDGTLTLNSTHAVFKGEMSPGPDYFLYLSPSYVEDEAGFLAVKAQALQVGPVKTFNGFILELPQGVSLDDYNTAVIWCERFGEFISAGQFRQNAL